MKKISVLVSLYMTFILFFSSLLLGKALSYKEQATLLFLNVADFEMLNLERVNPQYIIFFVLLFNLIFYYLMNDTLESISFMNLSIFRVGKKRAIKTRVKELMKMFVHLLFVMNSVLFLLYLIFHRQQNPTDLSKEMMVVFIYLVRYLLLLFTLIFVYEIHVIIGKNSNQLLKIEGFYILCILVDIFTNSHLVTFSGEWMLEITYLLFLLVVSLLTCFKTYRTYTKTGDIL